MLKNTGLKEQKLERKYMKKCVFMEHLITSTELWIHCRECLNLLLDHITLRGRKVLEIGCGVGRWASLMSDKGAHYVGVGISPKMVEIAKKNIPNGEFYVINGEKLDFPNNYFDLTFSVTVLHHNPDNQKRKLIREMCRVTKKGGYIIILEDISHRKEKIDTFNMFPLSVENWIKEFSDHGCKPVKIIKHKFMQGALLVFCKRFPNITNNALFILVWTKIVEKLAQKLMPYRLFAGVGILFRKER